MEPGYARGEVVLFGGHTLGSWCSGMPEAVGPQALAAAGQLQRDLLPEHTTIEQDAPAQELSVTLGIPGKVADFLRAAELEPAERASLDRV